jgi:hypothetical protein
MNENGTYDDIPSRIHLTKPESISKQATAVTALQVFVVKNLCHAAGQMAVMVVAARLVQAESSCSLTVVYPKQSSGD